LQRWIDGSHTDALVFGFASLAASRFTREIHAGKLGGTLDGSDGGLLEITVGWIMEKLKREFQLGFREGWIAFWSPIAGALFRRSP